MTKLDLVIERIRQLPQAEQDVIIADLEAALDYGGESPLTAEQRAELALRLGDTNKQYVPHDQVVVHFEQKFGQ